MYEREPKTTKQMVMGPYLSIITLNVNGLNAPSKRQRLAEWIQKQDPYIYCIQETNLKNKGHIQTESEGLEKKYSTQMETKRKQESQYSYQME